MVERKIKYGIEHIHSEFSIKDSAMSVKELLQKAAEYGAPGVILTDHGVLSGTFPLINAAKELNEQMKDTGYQIKVVPGVEAYVQGDDIHTHNMHLILIPCDYVGYLSISKAVTASNKNIDNDIPRMTKEILLEYFGVGSTGHGHVIATSACIGGVLSQLLLQNNRIKKPLNAIEKKLSNPVNPEKQENIEILQHYTELEETISALTKKKKEYTAILKKSPTRLQKTEISLRGKEGYESAVEALEEFFKEQKIAEEERNKLDNQIALLTQEKKILSPIRKKIKDFTPTYESLKAKKQELLDSQKNEEQLMQETETALKEYIELFGNGNFYIELQYHGFDNELSTMKILASLAKKYNVPVVAANDAHFATNSENDCLARQINMSQRFNSWNELNPGDRELYIKTDEELIKALSNIADSEQVDSAMKGIGDILERCNVEFPKESHYPKYQLPDGETDSGVYLRKLAEAGISKRYPGDKWTEEYQKRMEYELDIIHRMGYDDYHLIVQDFLNYARELALQNTDRVGVGVGPGRGSAVGSIVCYLIGITDVDPMRHGLIFERYLNPERVSMPDIDSDFANYIRPSVIKYVREKYGEMGVCLIETNNEQPPKASIKAVGRVMGTPEYKNAAEQIAKVIKPKDNKHFNTKDESGMTLKERLETQFPDKTSLDVIKKASLIEGSIINYGTHAAGVVISDNGDISNYVPLKWNEDGWVCQCTKEDVEGNAHLLKMDFLGLRNLDIANKAIHLIARNHGVNINLTSIPFENAVFKNIFSTGKTTAVFQFESAGMKQMLTEFKPDSIEDIILLVAAYRPGPMQYLPEIKAVKSGTKKAKYIIPEMAEVLSSTYGKPVYQEQIQAIFNKFAGFSLGEADVIRRIMSKKKMSLLTDPKTNYKGKFIDGLIARGANPAEAESFWEELVEFANYSFNKSHAAAYAYLAYQTAYLKYYYPAEYFAAALCQADISKYPMLIKEIHDFGVSIIPPSISLSEETFTVKKNSIVFGINSIKGVGSDGVEIINERNMRPFTSFKDFVRRISINKNHLESLIRCGVFDEFCNNRDALAACSEHLSALAKSLNTAVENAEKTKMRLQEVVDEKAKIQEEKKLEKLMREIENNERLLSSFSIEDIDEDFEKKLEMEHELIGYYVSGHPMDVWQKPNNAVDICDLDENDGVLISGIIKTANEYERKKDGALFSMFTIEDETGLIKVACWAKNYTQKNKECIKVGSAVKVFGQCKVENEEENEKTLLFSASEISPLKKRVDFSEITERKANEYFSSRLFVTIPNVAQWLVLRDSFRKYADENGVILNVNIMGYRQTTLSYKVSRNIINSGLGVFSVNP